MRVLGIDPGYGRCGFAIIEEVNRDWECVTHGVITTDKDCTFAERYIEIANDLRQIISSHQPEMLAIEELFFEKNVKTGLRVAEVRGMIITIAAELGLSIVEVKPTEVKMALTGYGKADKLQMQEMVKTIFKFNEIPKPDDAADAVAIAWTGATKARYS